MLKHAERIIQVFLGYFSVEDEPKPMSGDWETKDVLFGETCLPEGGRFFGIHHDDICLDGM